MMWSYGNAVIKLGVITSGWEMLRLLSKGMDNGFTKI